MVVISIAAAIVAATFLILALFAIPMIIEARKTAAAAREFFTRTTAELQPILKDMRLLIDDLQQMTADASEKGGEVKLFMEALGDAGRNLRIINTVVGAVAGLLSTSSLWITGTKVAGKFILDRVSTKGGK